MYVGLYIIFNHVNEDNDIGYCSITELAPLLDEDEESVASLGWVTPGAATEGVTPLFFPENLATFFAHRCHYHYRFLLLSLGCHLLQGGV